MFDGSCDEPKRNRLRPNWPGIFFLTATVTLFVLCVYLGIEAYDAVRYIVVPH